MSTFYSIILFIHSWNRWLILIAAIAVIGYAAKGLILRSQYTDSQKKWSLVFISSLHIQLLAGLLLLFVLSPITSHAFSAFGAAMVDPVVRYWSMEHAVGNIIAVILAQVGSILVKRTPDSRSKHRRALIWTGIAFVIILAMIPMGMMGVSRPLFRF